MKKNLLWMALAVLILLNACSGSLPAAGTSTQPPVELAVMTHDSFAASESVIKSFEETNHVKVVFIKAGDAGAALNRAILSKNSPQADVFFGVDNTFLSRALEAGIFETYDSPILKDIPVEVILDTSRQALPVDYGDICINYDKAWFSSRNLPLPGSFEDLSKPAYRGLLVVENPATSSPGLAFLLATIAHFGPDKWVGYWKDLRANGVVVVNGWETAYYTNFSASSGKGPQPMVVSYASSPAAEVVFASTPLTEAPTASILAPGMCFRQVEFAGILKGTRQRTLAEKFIDFMLGTEFQQDIPLQMFVYPVNRQAKLPDEFVRYAAVPVQPARMDPTEIARSRSAWLQAWDEAVLR